MELSHTEIAPVTLAHRAPPGTSSGLVVTDLQLLVALRHLRIRHGVRQSGCRHPLSRDVPLGRPLHLPRLSLSICTWIDHTHLIGLL